MMPRNNTFKSSLYPCISSTDITAWIGSPHYHFCQRQIYKSYLVSLIRLVFVSAKPRPSHCITKISGYKIWYLRAELYTIQNYTDNSQYKIMHCNFILLEFSSCQFIQIILHPWFGIILNHNPGGNFHSWSHSLPNFYHFLLNSTNTFAFSNS